MKTAMHPASAAETLALLCCRAQNNSEKQRAAAREQRTGNSSVESISNLVGMETFYQRG